MVENTKVGRFRKDAEFNVRLVLNKIKEAHKGKKLVSGDFVIFARDRIFLEGDDSIVTNYRKLDMVNPVGYEGLGVEVAKLLASQLGNKEKYAVAEKSVVEMICAGKPVTFNNMEIEQALYTIAQTLPLLEFNVVKLPNSVSVDITTGSVVIEDGRRYFINKKGSSLYKLDTIANAVYRNKELLKPYEVAVTVPTTPSSENLHIMPFNLLHDRTEANKIEIFNCFTSITATRLKPNDMIATRIKKKYPIEGNDDDYLCYKVLELVNDMQDEIRACRFAIYNSNEITPTVQMLNRIYAQIETDSDYDKKLVRLSK